MSAIAEWYVLSTSRIPALAAVCQLVKRSVFRAPARDYEAFWAFLNTHGTHGTGLDASGWVMNPLLALLQERFDVPVAGAEQHPLSKTIAVDTFLIIEAADAERWLTGLARAIDDREGLTAYLVDWYGDDMTPSAGDVDLHVGGLRYLRDGIATLTPDSVLLLSIG
jgi:hypothetical protein